MNPCVAIYSLRRERFYHRIQMIENRNNIEIYFYFIHLIELT